MWSFLYNLTVRVQRDTFKLFSGHHYLPKKKKVNQKRKPLRFTNDQLGLGQFTTTTSRFFSQ